MKKDSLLYYFIMMILLSFIVFIHLFGISLFFIDINKISDSRLYIYSLIIASLISFYLVRKELQTVRYVEKKDKRFMASRNINIAKAIYFSIGIMIVMFPPQYYQKEFYYEMYGRFNFILNTQSIDIYFISFELMSYLAMGFVFYYSFLRKSN